MIQKINNIVANKTRRISTGFFNLDRILGNQAENFGLPIGAISVMFGQSGTGKTRIVSQMMNYMNFLGNRIVIFQGEMTVQQYKNSLKKTIINQQQYYISQQTNLNNILYDIGQCKPDFAVIDSVNQLDGFDSRVKLKQIMVSIRQCAKYNRCHIMLIAQQNADGTMKGQTILPHLSDILIKTKRVIQKVDKQNVINFDQFYLSIQQKNRFGHIGGKARFRHTDLGIQQVHDVPIQKNNSYNSFTYYDYSDHKKQKIKPKEKIKKQIKKKIVQPDNRNWVNDGISNILHLFG